MRIEKVDSVTDELFSAMQRLVPQLGAHKPIPSWDELDALVKSEASVLLIARDATFSIVGMLTLSVYRVPTGIRSIIEDVVVDEVARGQGIGEALMRSAIELAKERGANNISLTSNPLREAANRLYLRMGFIKRETNAYQMSL